MQVLSTVKAFAAWRTALDRGRIVVFVPTMGFLHEGHLSLLREGRRLAGGGGVLVLSIFVNPTQFGPSEDLAVYPRDQAGDLEKARGCGVDAVLLPDDPGEIYPPGAATWVNVDGLDAHLCGARRPGHFRGVCTVVTKLWNIVRPDASLFGEKDFQQLAILRRVHRDLFFSGEVVGMPIVRESDGLAMSSRNNNLNPRARQDALAIRAFLQEVERRYADGERGVAALLAGGEAALSAGEVDYLSIVDAETLQPILRAEGAALCAAAVSFGGVRLIDNVVLRP